jgi:hypothetical membrane protein
MESGIGIRTPKQAIRILALLVESGMIYILIGVSFALVYDHGLSQFLFYLKVTSLALIVISTRFGLTMPKNLSIIVGIQLVVRNSF